jgi:hypothetical protein
LRHRTRTARCCGGLSPASTNLTPRQPPAGVQAGPPPETRREPAPPQQRIMMRVLRRRPRPRAKTFRPVEGYLLAAAAAGDALRSDPNPATQLMRRSTSSRRQFQGRSSAGSGPAYPPSIRLLRRRSASTTTRSQAGLADLRSRHGNASTPPASASAHAPNVRSPSPSIRGFDSPRLHLARTSRSREIPAIGHPYEHCPYGCGPVRAPTGGMPRSCFCARSGGES